MSDHDLKGALPEGLAMAMAQNPGALDAFGALSRQEKAHYIERAHHVSSKAEMQALLSELGGTHTL